MTDSLSKFVGVSTLAHMALAVSFLLHAYLAPSDRIDLRTAIRVDVVGLPEKAQTLPEKEEPAKAAPEKAQPQPIVTEAPKVNLNKKKNVAKEQKKALQEIKAMAALDKIKNEVAKQKVKGNALNAGNALTGLEKIDYDRYFHDVEQRIQQNWSLPQWLADAHLRAQVLVMIDENGLIKKKQVLRSSGNPEFDARMMDAIDKSAPFPAPPGRLRDVLAIKGIVFSFPQRGES